MAFDPVGIIEGVADDLAVALDPQAVDRTVPGCRRGAGVLPILAPWSEVMGYAI